MFTETLIVLNSKMAQMNLIKPLSIQIANVHQIANVPFRLVQTSVYDVLKKTVEQLLIELNSKIDYGNKIPGKAYNECFPEYFQFSLQLAHQRLIRDILTEGNFTVKSHTVAFEQMMFNYRFITRMVIRNLRNIAQDFENQDRFFEVHLEQMMTF